MRRTRIGRLGLAAALALCFGQPAAAQYFGVLQSAETNDRGTFKFTAAPLMLFGENGADNEFGGVARAGYGFTDRFDAEAKVSVFENSTFVGVDGEFWILKSRETDAGLDISLTGGVHWMFGRKGNADRLGFEVTPTASWHATKRLELCGSVLASFESIRDAPPGADNTLTTVHVVPGIEYHVSDTVDLVGEVGIGLSDNSRNYAAAGIAIYVR